MTRSTRFFSFLVVAGVMFFAAANAHAQASSATASSSASATVITAIAISNTAALNFGEVIAGGSTGTVVVTTAGARSATGGAALGSASGVAAASFTVTGDANNTYAITLPASDSVASGANTMTVDTFVSNPSGTGDLGAGGSQTLLVGATLQVGISQATGSYTGSFDVTVAYN